MQEHCLTKTITGKNLKIYPLTKQVRKRQLRNIYKIKYCNKSQLKMELNLLYFVFYSNARCNLCFKNILRITGDMEIYRQIQPNLNFTLLSAYQ